MFSFVSGSGSITSVEEERANLSAVDQLPRLGKRELICLLLFACVCVVSVRRGFLLLWELGMGCVILLWHSLILPYNYFVGPESSMLFVKTKDHRISGSGEEDFGLV